jgi:hypothetical protein
MNDKKLGNISEIRRFFHRNEDPVYFISARLCCANQLTNGSPLSPDGFTPRLS